MKKHYALLASVLTAGLAFAQQVNTSNAMTKQTITHSASVDAKYMGPQVITTPSAGAPVAASSMMVGQILETQIGESTYDLQSNSGNQSRLVLHSNGVVTATWTNSISSNTSFPDRGTGYNSFNGTEWGDIPTERIEQIRTGWPENLALPGGKEMILSHVPGASDPESNQVMTRDQAGSGQWNITTYTNDANGALNILWPRMAAGGSDGNTVHIIGLNNPGGGDEFNFSYSRSLNGGLSLESMEVTIPGTEDSVIERISGDGYAIAAHDTNVAIVLGGSFENVYLFHSSDNGDTWNRDIIWDWPWEPGDVIPGDTIGRTATADENFSIFYDQAGELHVIFGSYYVSDDNLADDQSSYFPLAGQELLHWQESYGFVTDTSAEADGITGAFTQLDTIVISDVNGDGTFGGPFTEVGTYFNALVSQSSAFVAENGDIYVAYAGIADTAYEDQIGSGEDFEKYYRHIFITRSMDNGATWDAPRNITKAYIEREEDVFVENVFPDIVVANDQIHVLFQRDEIPGLHVRGDEHIIIENKIIVATMDVNNWNTLGVQEMEENGISFSLYPNPTEGNLFVELGDNMSEQSYTVDIINTLGQVVLTTEMTPFGVKEISLNGVQKGMYFVKISGENMTTTQKVMVK